MKIANLYKYVCNFTQKMQESLSFLFRLIVKIAAFAKQHFPSTIKKQSQPLNEQKLTLEYSFPKIEKISEEILRKLNLESRYVKKTALARMEKNFEKACKEHQVNSPPSCKLSQNLSLDIKEAENQGKRVSMEDTHFYVTDPKKGTLIGVFDGHGGSEVSKYANQYFQVNFFTILELCENDVYKAFEVSVALIQDYFDKRVSEFSFSLTEKEKENLKNQGATMVVCFIDQKNIIYTATLGDSEANIYRKINGTLQSIPLSCIRDWSSEKDKARIPQEKKSFLIDERPKPRFMGVNVSRSIGDIDTPEISKKPKITVCKTLLPGDMLILASDGLKDFYTETEIITTISEPTENPAKKLVDEVLKKQAQLQDNITVVAIRCAE